MESENRFSKFKKQLQFQRAQFNLTWRYYLHSKGTSWFLVTFVTLHKRELIKKLVDQVGWHKQIFLIIFVWKIKIFVH